VESDVKEDALVRLEDHLSECLRSASDLPDDVLRVDDLGGVENLIEFCLRGVESFGVVEIFAGICLRVVEDFGGVLFKAPRMEDLECLEIFTLFFLESFENFVVRLLLVSIFIVFEPTGFIMFPILGRLWEDGRFVKL
jgi:hypothetical protein